MAAAAGLQAAENWRCFGEFLQLMSSWASMHELHVHFLLQRPRLLVARLADLVMAASSPVSDTFAHNTSADGEAPMLRPRKRSPTIEAAMNNWQTALLVDEVVTFCESRW